MPDFGFSLFRMSGWPIPVDIVVLVMEILVGEVKLVVMGALTVTVEITSPCCRGNVLPFHVFLSQF